MTNIEKLIDQVIVALHHKMDNQDDMTSRAILSTNNDNADRIMRMIERFKGEGMIYHSFDTTEIDLHGYYIPEFKNSLTANEIPPHTLKLEITYRIILPRNIDPATELCKDTSLLIRGFQERQRHRYHGGTTRWAQGVSTSYTFFFLP